MPELHENWHIYAIDVYGHGESTHEGYSVRKLQLAYYHLLIRILCFLLQQHKSRGFGWSAVLICIPLL